VNSVARRRFYLHYTTAGIDTLTGGPQKLDC